MATQPQQGTGYINTQSYLNANPTVNLGNTIGQDVSNQTSNYQNQLNSATNQFDTASNAQNLGTKSNYNYVNGILGGNNGTAQTTNSTTNAYDPSNTNAMVSNVSGASAAPSSAISNNGVNYGTTGGSNSNSGTSNINGFLNATYNAPSMAGITNLGSQAQNIQNYGQALQSPSTTGALLGTYYGSNSANPYTTGEQALDTAFMNTPQSGNSLNAARTQALQAMNSQNQAQTNATNLGTQNQQGLSNFQSNIGNQINQDVNSLVGSAATNDASGNQLTYNGAAGYNNPSGTTVGQGLITQELQNANNAQYNQEANLGANLSNGQLTQTQQGQLANAGLGLTGGQQLYGIGSQLGAGGNFLNNTALTQNSVASAPQIQALLNLQAMGKGTAYGAGAPSGLTVGGSANNGLGINAATEAGTGGNLYTVNTAGQNYIPQAAAAEAPAITAAQNASTINPNSYFTNLPAFGSSQMPSMTQAQLNAEIAGMNNGSIGGFNQQQRSTAEGDYNAATAALKQMAGGINANGIAGNLNITGQSNAAGGLGLGINAPVNPTVGNGGTYNPFAPGGVGIPVAAQNYSPNAASPNFFKGNQG